MTETVRCARCGRSWTAELWQQLPVKEMLSSADVSAHVSAWPEDAVVQVRVCTGCGGSIARTQRGASSVGYARPATSQPASEAPASYVVRANSRIVAAGSGARRTSS
jgi:hypothetical protein